MRKNKWRKYIVLSLVAAGLITGFSRIVHATVRPTEVSTARSGNVLVSIDGTFVHPDREAVLKRLNEIRLEAYKNGWTNEYVPVTWSYELEQIAQTRAAESSLYQGHNRLNGFGTFDISYNGRTAYAENLAWNFGRDSQAMMAAIEQWYAEKADYIQMKNGATSYGQTGHYEHMICPGYRQTALATFFHKTDQYYTSTTQLSTFETDHSQALTNQYGSMEQVIEVQHFYLSQYNLEARQALVLGEKDTAYLQATVTAARYQTVSVPAKIVSGITWTSSNPSVATVDAHGVISSRAIGKTTITATVGNQSISKEVVVKAIVGFEAINRAIKSTETVNLPTVIRANWSDGSTTSEAVTWAAIDTTNDATTAIVRKVTGTVAGSSLQPVATVTVHGIARLEPISLAIKSGTVPVLPLAVTAVWTDGTSTLETVTWNPILASSYTVTKPSQFIVAGNSLRTKLQPQARISVATISAIQPVSVTTHSGIVPNLPKTVTATWSDGTQSSVVVSWAAVSASTLQSFTKTQATITGEIGGTSLPAKATVTVHAISHIEPIVLTTPDGQAPNLPKTVAVRWTDQTTSQEPVVWDSIAKTLYTNIVIDREFGVQGRVSQTNVRAVATVTVIAQTIPLYRMYHPDLKVHLYTKDTNEYRVLATRGWRQEGLAWQTAANHGEIVYRMYQPDLRVHLYTKDANEYRVLATRGWRQEGVAFRSFGSIPIYRLYNPVLRKHLYTRDLNEYTVLAGRGWKQEGVAFYAVK